MGAGFCNLNSLKWLTEEPLTPARMHEQRSKQSHKVGREEEGMSSNRPELVALRECLEAHPDNENLLYLTDSEDTLQAINKWIGGGAKLSLTKTADTDVLRATCCHRTHAATANDDEECEKQSWEDWDLPDHRREATHIQNHRSIPLGSRGEVPTPQEGKPGPLEHSRLGLVGCSRVGCQVAGVAVTWLV
jgi:ribonuclease HI